ncbi:hypothetical protein [Candidatus Lokiarchaeum ossiferum]
MKNTRSMMNSNDNQRINNQKRKIFLKIGMKYIDIVGIFPLMLIPFIFFNDVESIGIFLGIAAIFATCSIGSDIYQYRGKIEKETIVKS